MANNSGTSSPASGELFDHDKLSHGGDALRLAREAAGIDIPTLSSELRIPKNYLAALEDEAYDELPGATYGFGYVRSYCKFLGIDAQPFLDTYKMRISAMQSAQQYHFPDEVLEPKMSGAMTAMLVVLTLLSGYIGWQVLDRYELNPLTKQTPVIVADSTPVADVSVAEVSVEMEDKLVSAETQQVSDADIADAPQGAQEVQSVSEAQEEERTEQAAINASVGEEAPQPEAEAEAEEAVEIAQSESIVDKPAAVETNEGTAQANVRKPADEIIVTATAAAWVEVVSENGDVVLSKLFQAGENYIAPADQKFYLSTGNAGGLVLAIPGLDKFQAGKVGEIIRDLPLSRDSLRSRRSAVSQ